MPGLSSRSRARASSNIWPGFVDALATLLMVIIFLLMIFVLAQFFLSEALSGRDEALGRLQSQVAELGSLLALERKTSEELGRNVERLSAELQTSIKSRDDLAATVEDLTLRATGAEERGEQLQRELKQAFSTIESDKEKIRIQLAKVADLAEKIEALEALKEELEKQAAEMLAKQQATETALADEQAALAKEKAALAEEKSAREKEAETRQQVELKLAEEKSAREKEAENRQQVEFKLAEQVELSETARAQVALLNKQMKALRDQIATLNEALEASEKKAEGQQVQITSLGKRLNAALASKVQQLARYRSEFFGRLRDMLGKTRDVRIVGDRFVFQSEVLFDTGSADLGGAGQMQLERLAGTLSEIAIKIPDDIDWVLRVDGHTDRVPIRNERFPSNWELSAARAISVVKYLIAKDIPPERLVAAGFGEQHPLDKRTDEIAYRRNRRIEFKLTQR